MRSNYVAVVANAAHLRPAYMATCIVLDRSGAVWLTRICARALGTVAQLVVDFTFVSIRGYGVKWRPSVLLPSPPSYILALFLALLPLSVLPYLWHHRRQAHLHP